MVPQSRVLFIIGEGINMFQAEIEHQTLSNGATFTFAQVPNASFSKININFLVGARDEKPHQHGMAHFVEHLIANHAPEFNKRSLNDHFRWMYGLSCNASTDLTETEYFAEGFKDPVHDYIDLLSSSFLVDKFNPKIVERERSRIISEFSQGEDNMDKKNFFFINRVLYGDHPASNITIGNIDVVKGVTSQELYDFYQDQYQPHKAILSAAGHIDRDRILNNYQSITDALQSSTSLTPFIYPDIASNYGIEHNNQSNVVYSSLIFRDNVSSLDDEMEKTSMYKILSDYVSEDARQTGSHYHVDATNMLAKPYRFARFSVITKAERAQESIVGLINVIKNFSEDRIVDAIPAIQIQDKIDNAGSDESYRWRANKGINNIRRYGRVLGDKEKSFINYINENKVSNIMESYRQSMDQVPIVTFFGNVKDANLPQDNQWVIDAMRGPK
jgi:predicted Zn-dependent peptidase